MNSPPQPLVEYTDTGEIICTVETDSMKYALWFPERCWDGLGLRTLLPRDHEITAVRVNPDGTSTVTVKRKDS
ncbi:MAG: hypothetical protein ACYTF7_10595 [Planctomycetota bacterium]|jgi:hypothetical protein